MSTPVLIETGTAGYLEMPVRPHTVTLASGVVKTGNFGSSLEMAKSYRGFQP